MAKVSNFKSLLDCWAPPQIPQTDGTFKNPVPVGFISTTFTFDSEFFEEECLTRFLVMETEKENDGAAFLVEKEEKLAGLSMGLVLVDQTHCRGERSLRWHLQPCRVQQGIMHAKINILQWSDCIRLIIGSANLTKPGLCINQESYVCIDYYQDAESDISVLNSTLSYLQSMVDDFCGQLLAGLFNNFQLSVKNTIGQWALKEATYKKDDVSITTLFVSPKERNALERLRNIWNDNFYSPPDEAHIVSPFYDAVATDTTPSIKITDILQLRGGVSTYYYLPADEPNEEGKPYILHGPDILAKKIKSNHEVYFVRVPEEGKNEKEATVPRPMHLKQIWLSKGDFNLLMLGSSNFTTAALGTGKRVNYEANLVYVFDEARNRKAKDWMKGVCPDNELIESENLQFQETANQDEVQTEQELPNLPLFFTEAILSMVNDEYLLYLRFNIKGEKPPKDFKICYSPTGKTDNIKCVFSEQDWLPTKQEEVVIKWKNEQLPDSLLVGWQHALAYAFWPVLIESQSTLPPIEALRNLPLEALLHILSSSQPLHRLLKVIERMKTDKAGENTEVALNPHLLVDTSKFLLQRTRRISYAMKAMRERLEKPVYTRESLSWRISGPIGIDSLKEAILKEAQSPEEKYFLFAELALELSRVSPQETEVSLRKEEVKEAIRDVLKRIADELNFGKIQDTDPVLNYSMNAIKKSLNEL